MKISERAFELIKQFEGLHLRAYQCPAGARTIGYGHTAGMQSGDVITASQTDVLLRDDVTLSERAVNQYVSVSLTQYQSDTPVSFTLNPGGGDRLASTLLKTLNAGDAAGAADEILRWVNADGKWKGRCWKPRHYSDRTTLRATQNDIS